MNEVDSLWEGEVFMVHHMAHEMIHSISLRKISMLLKLGIGKAYESGWTYSLQGFGEV